MNMYETTNQLRSILFEPSYKSEEPRMSNFKALPSAFMNTREYNEIKYILNVKL